MSEGGAEFLPGHFRLIRRTDRFAIICTDVEPLDAALFFESCTPGEAWEPSQAHPPERCAEHEACRRILLSKKGSAYVN